MHPVTSSARKGFTLIELLVVIAIIGILSSVVLTSIRVARDKGQDAAVRSNLSGIRAQAELYHDANNKSFANVCIDNAGAEVKSIYTLVWGATLAGGGNAIGTGPTTELQSSCNSDDALWAAEAALKTGGFYCVDSVGGVATSSVALLQSSADLDCQ